MQTIEVKKISATVGTIYTSMWELSECSCKSNIAKKRPKHVHVLCSVVVRIKQQKSTYVMSKHPRICLGIFA